MKMTNAEALRQVRSAILRMVINDIREGERGDFFTTLVDGTEIGESGATNAQIADAMHTVAEELLGLLLKKNPRRK